jgi:hypothetical protein
MDNAMPTTFPEEPFRAFLKAASTFFPALMSEENLSDPKEKRRHFDWSWQAVRYRYRTCAECDDEFRGLLGNASELWRAGWVDEELMYKLERCIFLFFMSGLSVFDSLALCLYFLGNAMRPAAFPDVANPRNITLAATSKVLSRMFPNATISRLLAGLPQDSAFGRIGDFRNILAHRISGRRSIRESSTIHPGGVRIDWREDTWHVPSAKVELIFNEEMLHHNLNDISRLLSTLVPAAREFAESQIESIGPRT